MASLPSIWIRPEVGSMIRLIIFRVVVFPHPDGPMRVTHSPRPMSRLRSLTAARVLAGKTFVTFSSRIIASPATRTS